MKITKNLVVSKLPPRPISANKGTFGSVLIIAGSKNYPGAAMLSVLSAARVGSGLITLSTTSEVHKIIVPEIPFATFLSFSEIEENLKKYDSVLIGPGLGRNNDLRFKIKEWINLSVLKNKKLVLDADGLNNLTKIIRWEKLLKEDIIFTPHPGEMSRLTGLSIEKIQKNRQEVSKKFAKFWNKTIVLKGAETVIADPKGEIFISPFSNPLLATAGTGDVLAGLIAGLLAQGLSLADASIVGVYIHGLAGEKLKEKFGDRGATADDLVGILPSVFKTLLRRSSN